MGIYKSEPEPEPEPEPNQNQNYLNTPFLLKGWRILGLPFAAVLEENFFKPGPKLELEPKPEPEPEPKTTTM